MRKLIPIVLGVIVLGVIVLLVGIGWASQGAGMMGGSGLMDNNTTFVYLGGALAVVGLALIVFGALMKPSIGKPSTQ